MSSVCDVGFGLDVLAAVARDDARGDTCRTELPPVDVGRTVDEATFGAEVVVVTAEGLAAGDPRRGCPLDTPLDVAAV
jgi:hypothetical protein